MSLMLKKKSFKHIHLCRENVEYLTHQNEKLLKENGKLSEQITNAMNLIKERDKDKEKLMRQVKVDEQQALIQQKELTERYDQKILKLKDQFTELRNQISLLTERNIKLYNEIKEMSNHETELWKEIDVRDRSIQNYMQKIEEYKCLVNSTNLQLTQYKNELDSFKYEVEKLTRAVFRMTYWLDCNLCMEFASNSLSAFSKFYFTIDGVKCISVESFLQSLKFKNIKKQQLICDMPPEQAVKLGNKKKLWKQTDNLWWKGNKIKRSSSDYQLLLNCVFDELCKNNNFIRVLMDCGNIEILRTVNTIGRHSVMLSEDEFVSRLVNMRSLLQR